MIKDQLNILKQNKDLFPNQVRYRSLGDVCKIETGRLDANAAVTDGNYMFFTTAREPSRIDRFRWDTEALLIAGNANVGEVKHYNGKFEAYQRTYVLTNFSKEVNARYLFFLLRNDLKKHLESHTNSAAMTYIVLSSLQKTIIPVPPLSIQQEIVKILDNFTELEAGLEAELEARKKQYEYYREELLTFRDGIELKTLGTILQRTKGTPITARQMSEMNKAGAPIKIFAGGRTVAYVDYGDIPKKDVLMERSVVVKSRGIIAFEYIDKPFSHKNEFWSYHSKYSNINIKYIYYYLKNKESYFQTVGQKKSKMPQLSIPDTDKFEIPVPSISEQERIVTILDKFDALVNDLSIGLPAELAARRQQYEYYRNKLLTFKEIEHVK